MNTDISEIAAEPADSAATQDVNRSEKPRGGGYGLAFLALLVALAALLAAAWLWWQGKSSAAVAESPARSDIVRLEATDSRLSAQLQELREELESQPDGPDDARFEALQTAMTENREQAAALQRAMQEQITLARSTQSAIEALHGRLVAAESALAGLNARELDARGELDLAEVDYLLRLANERLLLFADPRSADRALALADGHLAALDNPAYLGVRQAIAAARGDLAALDLPDDPAIAGQLEAIQQAIPGLPFRPASPSASESEAPAAAGWWEKLKATLANLVTVRRSTEQESRRISLQDKDYIRERLWTQVEVSYLALMRHDQDAFHNGLQRVQASLAEWFDPASSEVAAVAQTLDTLLAVDIAVAWPDISEPWNTLRLVRAAQSIAKPASPAQPPATPMPDQPPAEPDVPKLPADGESGGGKP